MQRCLSYMVAPGFTTIHIILHIDDAKQIVWRNNPRIDPLASYGGEPPVNPKIDPLASYGAEPPVNPRIDPLASCGGKPPLNPKTDALASYEGKPSVNPRTCKLSLRLTRLSSTKEC